MRGVAGYVHFSDIDGSPFSEISSLAHPYNRAPMPTFETIGVDSPYFEAVLRLGKRHKKTLGFLPKGAFEERALAGKIIGALVDGECVGYVMYRVSRSRANITHLCVAEKARKQGVSHGLLAALRGKTAQLRGVVLHCRRDFAANDTWLRLGFHFAGEKAGRAADGSTLNRWALNYGHRGLFDDVDEPSLIEAAMDFNIFLDLMDGRHVETEGLQADWIRPLIALCYTDELLNEIGRNDDAERRLRRVREAQRFHRLECSDDAFESALATLLPLFPNLSTPREESDFRHLVRAAAAQADAFITRDTGILRRADAVFGACELRVLRPANFIARIDSFERRNEYQRRYLAGAREVIQARASSIGRDVLEAIVRGGESQKSLQATLHAYLAKPDRSRCHQVADEQGKTLAFYVVDRDASVIRVPVLRICDKRRGPTLARSVLTGVIREAAASGVKAVFVTDPDIPAMLESALDDLGFLTVAGGRLKVVLRGWLAADDVVSALDWSDPRIDELKDALPEALATAEAASRFEHLISPGKLADAPIPCYIVPIDPAFASELFDERLANRSLFGADVDLALNPESAYYRAARPRVLTCPGRVLWYVKDKRREDGTKAIRACSRIVELCEDTPSCLFSRFERLGVYEWADVRATAKGDLAKSIQAFRFDDTELLQHVPWGCFQAIMRRHGKGHPLQSPAAISPAAFGEIYALALDSSAPR